MTWTVRCNRVAYRLGGLAAGLALTAGAAAGCSAGGHGSSSTTSVGRAPSTAAVTSTIAPGAQTSGPRTVLSPVGLHVRAAPHPSAAVLGSAAQGVVLTVLGYSDGDGGWLQVKGATVTGWISAKPTLSAAGEFRSYYSAQFSALYPATWTESALNAAAQTPTTTSSPAPPTSTGATTVTPSSVAFHPATGAGDIVVMSAGGPSQLPQGRTGYGRKSVSSVVACGTTAALVVYQQTGAAPTTTSATALPESLTYRAEVRFTVDKDHALGLYADMPDLGSTFQVFKDLVSSLTYSAPQCTG